MDIGMAVGVAVFTGIAALKTNSPRSTEAIFMVSSSVFFGIATYLAYGGGV